jgi:hypothetical protein
MPYIYIYLYFPRRKQSASSPPISLLRSNISNTGPTTQPQTKETKAARTHTNQNRRDSIRCKLAEPARACCCSCGWFACLLGLCLPACLLSMLFACCRSSSSRASQQRRCMQLLQAVVLFVHCALCAPCWRGGGIAARRRGRTHPADFVLLRLCGPTDPPTSQPSGIKRTIPDRILLLRLGVAVAALLLGGAAAVLVLVRGSKRRGGYCCPCWSQNSAPLWLYILLVSSY